MIKDRSEQNTRPLKKPYMKPEVKQVQLRPEEAVLGFCKTSSTAGPAKALCSTITPCSILGS